MWRIEDINLCTVCGVSTCSPVWFISASFRSIDQRGARFTLITAEILTVKASVTDQPGSILLEKSTSINATACATMRQICAASATGPVPRATKPIPAGDAGGRDRGKGGHTTPSDT